MPIRRGRPAEQAQMSDREDRIVSQSSTQCWFTIRSSRSDIAASRCRVESCDLCVLSVLRGDRRLS